MHVGGHSTWASPFGPRHLPLSQMRKTIHRTGTRGRSGVQAARGMSQPIACILMTTRRDHSGLVRMKMSFRSICMTSNHSIISKRQPISIWVSFCLSIFGFQFIICFIISLASKLNLKTRIGTQDQLRFRVTQRALFTSISMRCAFLHLILTTWAHLFVTSLWNLWRTGSEVMPRKWFLLSLFKHQMQSLLLKSVK